MRHQMANTGRLIVHIPLLSRTLPRSLSRTFVNWWWRRKRFAPFRWYCKLVSIFRWILACHISLSGSDNRRHCSVTVDLVLLLHEDDIVAHHKPHNHPIRPDSKWRKSTSWPFEMPSIVDDEYTNGQHGRSVRENERDNALLGLRVQVPKVLGTVDRA